jgi:hypothetical protein
MAKQEELIEDFTNNLRERLFHVTIDDLDCDTQIPIERLAFLELLNNNKQLLKDYSFQELLIPNNVQ